MYDVKRAEAQGLLSELKAFTFEQSKAFANGTLSGIEISKTFYCTDPVPEELREYMEPDMYKLDFNLQALRTDGRGRKPHYEYELTSSLQRTLDQIPSYQKQLVLEEGLEDIVDTEIDDTAFSEYNAILLEVSDYEPREIIATHKYAILYMAEIVFERSSDDVLYDVSGMFAGIPSAESNDALSHQFIPDPITHEQLDDVTRTLTQFEFESIINREPAEASCGNFQSYRNAAERIRYIIDVLRHDLNNWV